MKIKETNKGKEFIFKNKFSKNRISKNDRKLHSLLKFKYKLINFLHLKKFFNKKSWYRLMDLHWGKKEEKQQSISHPRIKDKIIISSDDLYLEDLVIYDLLPKEYLAEFEEKYIKFKMRFSDNYMFNKRESSVKESFEHMHDSNVVGCWFDTDWFSIKSNTNLSRYFSSVSLHAIGLTQSYYILKYSLTVNDKANSLLLDILSSKVHKEEQCVSNGKWWKRKSFDGCITYDMSNDAKVYAIDDCILELKSVFWNELNKNYSSKFFDWKVIPPSIEIYSSKTLNSNKDNILELMASRSQWDVQCNSENTVFFVPAGVGLNEKGLKNSRIISDVAQFKGRKEGQIYPFLYVEETICEHLADYFVLDSLLDIASERVNDSQIKINKSIYSKSKFNELLKLKFNIDKKLYFYKRLCKELISIKDYKIKNSGCIKRYNEMFSNIVLENGSSSNITFQEKYESIFYIVKEKNDLIKTIYEHFEENAKMVESRFNYKVVVATFIVGIASLLATIIFSNDFGVIKSIGEWFQNLVSQ